MGLGEGGLETPHRRLSKDILDVFIKHISTIGLSCRGVKGDAGDKVGSQSEFPAPLRKVHCGHPGIRKPPPSMVPLLLYSGSMGSPECLPQHNIPVYQGLQGGGAETA